MVEPTTTPPTEPPDIPEARAEAEKATASAQEVARIATQLRAQLARVIVGQEEVIDLLLVSVLARGHGLLEGVPGLAKTLLVRSLAQATHGSFSRIQFTPDLLPSDITGTEILEEDRTTGRRELKFVRGPVFANLVLADEINRTPPKTQAALLQAMQEGEVTASGRTLQLPKPFLVFATQNPVEQEGTYPLPEAQLDRFMFMIEVGYPSHDEELAIVERTTTGEDAEPIACVSPEELVQLQKQVRAVPAGPEVVKLAVELVRATRPGDGAADVVRDWVSWGAGPRASQYLVLGGKARALLRGRTAVTREDIRALAYPVLRHRVLLNFRAEAEGVKVVSVIDRLLDLVDPLSRL